MIFARHRTVKELQDRVETLEKAKRELELEWQLAYEKLRTLMGRIAKRAGIDAAAADEDRAAAAAQPSSAAVRGNGGRTPGQIRAEALKNAILRR